MFYLYKVTYWDTIDTCERTERGLVHAKNYGKAANKLIDTYNADCIVDIYLREIDATSVMFEEEIEEMFK